VICESMPSGEIADLDSYRIRFSFISIAAGYALLVSG